MRIKSIVQGILDYIRPSSARIAKEVKDYRTKYEKVSEILDANPRIVALAHEDFCRFLSESREGRKSPYSTEQILRALIVMFIEKTSYRMTVVRIDTSEFLRGFVRLGMKPVMNFSFLSRAFSAIADTTWKTINQELGRYAMGQEKIDGDQLRVDSTVYEANIHYPTDSSLLWDSYRTLARLMKGMRLELREVGLAPRFHVKKVKKLAYYISRNAKSTSKRKQRKVKRVYRTLIERVRHVVQVAQTLLDRWEDWELEELKHYVPLVEQVIYQAEQRVLHGIMLPADEKLYSLFEAHTELLKRGKAGKAVEFGHKIVVSQSAEKFITEYQVLPKRKDDKDLVDETVSAHKRLFGKAPQVLAADKGFYESQKKLHQLEKEIETVSIGKKGRRNGNEKARESTEEFKEGQRFRAGVEGSISVLKRVFKLNRCLFKGFKNYAASVGCAVFCHNLVLLTRL